MPCRCTWVTQDPLYQHYHDLEWGVPCADPGTLFEFLILEGAQAGLSWITILKKRENYRRLLDGFDPEKIALYDEAKVAALLADPGIVRNRLKIRATIGNARAWLDLAEKTGNPAAQLWQFVGASPQQHERDGSTPAPTHTAESDAMSRDLAARGFKFVGTTICYAFMQATGMVNDHSTDCFRHQQVREAGERFKIHL